MVLVSQRLPIGSGTASVSLFSSELPINTDTIPQIIGVITPYLVGTAHGDANLGAKVFFLWGSLCCISVTFAYFLVPEMKGLSLEQIDRMLEETTPRKSAKWKPHSTFAEDMGLVGDKGIVLETGAHIEQVDQGAPEKMA